MIKILIALILIAPYVEAGVERYSLRPLMWESLRPKTSIGPNLTPEEFKKIGRPLWLYHRIVPSDNIWKLAKDYGTTTASIQSTNSGELIWITPGSSILLQNKKGTLHRIKDKGGRGETLSDLARLYAKPGSDPEEIKEKIILANRMPGYYLLSDPPLAPESLVLIPDAYFEFDTFRIPFRRAWRISSGFGLRRHPILNTRKFHQGLDIPQPYGTPVYASRSGRVSYAGYKGGYGLVVIIKHSDSTSSLYGHLSHVSVRTGQIVEAKKKVIGKVGSTGLSTGPHLHFEIHDRHGRPINPKKKIR